MSVDGPISARWPVCVTPHALFVSSVNSRTAKPECNGYQVVMSVTVSISAKRNTEFECQHYHISKILSYKIFLRSTYYNGHRP